MSAVVQAHYAPAITIRAARPDDQKFVTRTMAAQLSPDKTPREYAAANHIVNRVMGSARVRVLVAIARDGRIIGWLAYTPIPRVKAVLFVYVRKDDRGGGIGRELARAAWPTGRGQWVHGGLRGSSSRALLQRFRALEMPLEDLI